jgi:hypothetical protein
VSFTDNGDGTASLSGSPATGTEGTYPISIAVSNGSGTAVQQFTLTVAKPPGGTTAVSEESPQVSFDGWNGVADGSASGGAYRQSKATGDTATVKFSGTSVTWLSRSGPTDGIAKVVIDGVSKGTVDLYSPADQPTSRTYSGLTSATHTLVIRVTGNKNAASKDRFVPVDGFTVGTTTTQEAAPTVRFDSWAGGTSKSATNSTYRSANKSGATASVTFTGTGVDYVTATGQGYGEAEVYIDGADRGSVDLYSATPRWQVLESFSGLSSGSHTIVVKVLGTKDPASTGTKVLVDGFVVHT